MNTKTPTNINNPQSSIVPMTPTLIDNSVTNNQLFTYPTIVSSVANTLPSTTPATAYTNTATLQTQDINTHLPINNNVYHPTSYPPLPPQSNIYAQQAHAHAHAYAASQTTALAGAIPTTAYNPNTTAQLLPNTTTPYNTHQTIPPQYPLIPPNPVTYSTQYIPSPDYTNLQDVQNPYYTHYPHNHTAPRHHY